MLCLPLIRFIAVKNLLVVFQRTRFAGSVDPASEWWAKPESEVTSFFGSNVHLRNDSHAGFAGSVPDVRDHERSATRPLVKHSFQSYCLAGNCAHSRPWVSQTLFVSWFDDVAFLVKLCQRIALLQRKRFCCCVESKIILCWENSKFIHGTLSLFALIPVVKFWFYYSFGTISPFQGNPRDFPSSMPSKEPWLSSTSNLSSSLSITNSIDICSSIVLR